MRLRRLLDVGELGHQLLIDVEPAARVDDQHVLALGDRAVAGPRGDLHRVAVGALLVDVGAGLRSDLDQLVDGGGAIHVAGGDGDRRAVLLTQIASELAGRGRLAGALEARHQDDRRRPGREREIPRGAAHQLGELVGDDLDHLLARVELADHVGAERFLLDRVRERLDDLEVDVGLKQRETDLTHCRRDVVLGQRAATADVIQGRLELFGEGVEHERSAQHQASTRDTRACAIAAAIRCRRRNHCSARTLGRARRTPRRTPTGSRTPCSRPPGRAAAASAGTGS